MAEIKKELAGSKGSIQPVGGFGSTAGGETKATTGGGTEKLAAGQSGCIKDCYSQYRQDLKRMSRSEASARRGTCIERCGEEKDKKKKSYLICGAGTTCTNRMISNEQLPGYRGMIAACEGLKEGDECRGGKKKALACSNGKCRKVQSATPEALAACNGKAVGDECGIGKKCRKDKDCAEGYTCNAEGKCVPFTKVGCVNDADCPTGYKCRNGECKKGKDGDGDGDGGGDGGGGESSEFKWSGGLSDALQGLLGQYNELFGSEYDRGEFEWSGMTQEAMQKLSDRYNYLMENPRGTTDAERQAIINFATERIKRGERGQMQSMTDRLSRIGMAGSGFEESQARAIGRGTREDVVSLQRQVAIDELDRRFTELMGGTEAAKGLLGTMMTGEQVPELLTQSRRGQWLNELVGKADTGRGMLSTLMTGEQIPEVLSAARRGEGTTAMQQLLAYMNMIMGSYNQGSSWLQGILG